MAKYDKLATDDALDTLQQRSQRKRSCLWISVQKLLFVLLAISASLYWYEKIRHAWPVDSDVCACGSSVEEAQARGCRFDPFALSWLPDACRDDDLIDHFLTLGATSNANWTFFTYPEQTAELTLDEVSEMALPVGKGRKQMVTTTVGWHQTHCLYLSLHQFRRSKTGKHVAPRYASEKHVTHCADTVLSWIWDYSPHWLTTAMSEVDIYEEGVEILPVEEEGPHH